MQMLFDRVSMRKATCLSWICHRPHTSCSGVFRMSVLHAAGPHQQQQYAPPPNMGGYAPPPQQSYPPPDRAGTPSTHGMGPHAGPPGASSAQQESQMRQEEQRRKRFREFKEEKPVRISPPISKWALARHRLRITVHQAMLKPGAAWYLSSFAVQQDDAPHRQAGLHARVLRDTADAPCVSGCRLLPSCSPRPTMLPHLMCSSLSRSPLALICQDRRAWVGSWVPLFHGWAMVALQWGPHPQSCLRTLQVLDNHTICMQCCMRSAPLIWFLC